MAAEPGGARPPRYVGTPVQRVEDPKFLTGRAHYADDLEIPGVCHAVFVRSPHAHARIGAIDVSKALALDGVIAVVTGQDLVDEVGPYVTLLWREEIETCSRRVLATDKVRHVGEAVAVVIAESPYLAEDGRDLVSVAWEPLEPVLDAEEALKPGAPLVDDELGKNNVAHMEETCGAVDEAFADAEVVFSGRFHSGRYGAAPLETKGVIAEHDPGTGEFTIWTGSQIPHSVRALVAGPLGVPESKVRVITPDVGGGFGGKGFVCVEEAIVPAIARMLGRPVKWIEDRWENLAASIHSKEMVMYHDIAAKRDGTLLGFRGHYISDSGAFSCYPYGTLMEALFAATMLPGLYDVRGVSYVVDSPLTNKCQIGAYRGIGWTAGHTAREVLVDEVAHELGIDPVELRLQNCVSSEPHVNVIGMSYDGGSYAEAMRTARDTIGYDELRARQRRLREQGRYLGIGFSPYIEATGFGSRLLEQSRFPYVVYDLASITIQPDGSVIVRTGLQNHGQGHETTMAQVAADGLGVRMDAVKIVQGDTASSVYGCGSHSSRSAVTGGGCILRAASDLREKLVKLAGLMLEASAEDIVLEDGVAHVKGVPSKSVTVPEISAFAYFDLSTRSLDFDPDLTATRFYDPPETFANGVIVVVAEVDPGTGVVDLQRVLSVKDCGTMLNPMIVRGQVAGAVAQGIGGALYEELAYDERGGFLAGSLREYHYPTTAELPPIEVVHLETPSPVTEGGIKGMGEGGSIAAPAAVVNAVADALRPFGVRVERTPLTPSEVLRLLDVARERGGDAPMAAVS